MGSRLSYLPQTDTDGKGVLTLESAVHKMTWQNAEKIGITDRGLVKPGMAADLMVFDPATIIDKATFSDPHQYSPSLRVRNPSAWIALK